jgi:hypothetical protein
MLNDELFIQPPNTLRAEGHWIMSAPALHPLYAQAVGEIVHGLNGVINPRDAQLLQDQARRNNRPAEERYWRDYRAGLEAPDRGGETGSGRDRGDLRFDPSNPRSFHSEAAISLELRRLSPGARRRYGEMTERERRKFDDRLAEDAQRRYERMTDPERRRYVDDLQIEQERLDSARRG